MTKKKVVKRPVRRVKKSLTLRQVLNVIDTALVKEDDTARAVWNVLTALRGPDSGSYMEKANHTIPIRYDIFLALSEGNIPYKSVAFRHIASLGVIEVRYDEDDE